MLEKPRYVNLNNILGYMFFHTNGPLAWYPKKTSKWEEIFDPNILMMIQTFFFFGEGLTVWGKSWNQFKPVKAETVENYPERKLELLSPTNRYIGHQGDIIKLLGQAIFFVKGPLLIKILFQVLVAVEVKKVAVFQIPQFIFVEKNFFL